MQIRTSDSQLSQLTNISSASQTVPGGGPATRRHLRISRWARWSPWLGLGLLVSLVSAGGAGCRSPETFDPTRVSAAAVPITCQVTRDECTQELLTEIGQFSCVARQTRTFTGTVCSRPEDDSIPANSCNRALCTPDPFTRPYGYSSCVVDWAGRAMDVVTAAELPGAGICAPIPAATGPARVEFRRRSLSCTPDPAGIACSALTLTTTESTEVQCVDVSTLQATVSLLPSTDDRGRSVRISRFEPNHPECAASATPEAIELAYTLQPGAVGTASAAGISTGLSVLGGFAIVRQTCDIDGGCQQTLSRLRANVANISVAGLLATNVVVTNTTPAPVTGVPVPGGTRPGFAPGALNLIAQAQVQGQGSDGSTFFIVENREPVAATVDPAGIRIAGTVRTTALDLAGRPLPVSVSVDLQGIRATPRDRACLDAPPVRRLFGFEDPELWRAPAATTTVVSAPVTEGCGALALEGSGYFTIEGGAFATAAVPVLPAVRVDLFIPIQQPNPYWVGALQMYLTCPSANAFNQYIGQVELTGMPQGRYSTLRFPVPETVSATLRQTLQDCFFTLALNVNATGQPWLLDNLRFTR